MAQGQEQWPDYDTRLSNYVYSGGRLSPWAVTYLYSISMAIGQRPDVDLVSSTNLAFLPPFSCPLPWQWGITRTHAVM